MPRARTLLLETYAALEFPANWNEGGEYKPGKQCIVTALFNACVNHSEHRSISGGTARKHICNAIRTKRHVPKGTFDPLGRVDIISWNDHPETVHYDVLQIMAAAIKSASFPWEAVPNGY